MSVYNEKRKEGNSKLKIDLERIEKLEEQICFLRKEIDCIKKEKVSAENAIEQAILRGVSALGGKYKVFVPEADGLNGSCSSDEQHERDSVCSSSTLSATQSRKKVPFRVNEESQLICPVEENQSVCSSKSESKGKKKEEQKCGNFQLG